MSGERAVLEQFCSLLISLTDRLDTIEADASRSPARDRPTAKVADKAAGDLIVTEADIRAAYRLLLGRPVDAIGLAHYLERAGSEEFGLDDLVHSLSDSEEYISRRARQTEIVDVDGLNVVVDPEEPEFGRAIARDKVWEAHVVKQVAAHLRPGDVFVDIGANVGVMSFHAARAVGPSGKIIAFEPNPDNVANFLRGVLINRFENVTICPMAASAKANVFTIRGNSNTALWDANLGGRLVQSIRADAILCGEPRIDFIKLDIEGHEPHALAGLSETLQRHKPVVLCEFNPRCLRENIGADPADFAHQLFDFSLSVEVVEHDGSLKGVTTPRDLMSLWEIRNADHVACGTLPDGMVHFDLLVRTA